MTRSHLFSVLFAAVVPIAAASCDGEATGFADADFPLCDTVVPGGLRVVGTLDGMSIDIALPSAGGGLTQIDGGELQYQGNYTSDPTMPDLRLAWPTGLLRGEVGDATGFIRLMEGTFAGQQLCAGEGTEVRIPRNGEANLGMVQFRLAGLGTGESCTSPLAGELRGCMGD